MAPDVTWVEVTQTGRPPGGPTGPALASPWSLTIGIMEGAR